MIYIIYFLQILLFCVYLVYVTSTNINIKFSKFFKTKSSQLAVIPVAMNIDGLKDKEKVVLLQSISPDAFERFNWDYRSQLFYLNF